MTRRPFRFVLASVAALLVLSGCKQADRTIAAKDYAVELASGYCEAVYSCSCDDYPYANFNVCYAELSQAYTDVSNQAAAAGLSYDGSCPVKTLEQLDGYACDSAEASLPAGACIPPCNAWHGSLPAGSFCASVASNAEAGVGFSACGQGLSCLGGVCVNPCQLGSDLPGPGEPCPEFVCDSGATCDLEAQICMALPSLPGPGESCVNGVCDPERAICVVDVNVCAALPSIGQPCVSNLCDGQSYCGPDDVCLARPPLVCGLLVGDLGGDGDGDGDPTGDGDGDPTTTGDGDGDPTGDGDGDPTTTGDGDGDPTGDGDGDPTGDGDGDPTTGDGDGDPVGVCGWNLDFDYYACGSEGSDPSGTYPYACPPGLVEGAPCGQLTGEGCCDANGNNWYCGDDGNSQLLVLELCG